MKGRFRPDLTALILVRNITSETIEFVRKFLKNPI